MTDTFVYTCGDCGTATCDGHQPVERDCAVCGARDWRRRGQVA